MRIYKLGSLCLSCSFLQGRLCRWITGGTSTDWEETITGGCAGICIWVR
ncbi:unnamed protein product [Linum tenue]|uniref:Uncharacterized protein n=1 Tax=Linum tenue TaxID=586396 RepID=A0AAV0RVC6_9ROSI|nr:unnamed protein product [Linum tenue]